MKKYKNKQTYAEEGRRKVKVRWMDIQEKKSVWQSLWLNPTQQLSPTQLFTHSPAMGQKTIRKVYVRKSVSILAGVKYTPFTIACCCPSFLSELMFYCCSLHCDPAMSPSHAQFLLNVFMFSEAWHTKDESTSKTS